MVVGSSLTYSCQLDRKLFFYFILTLFYPTEELLQENYLYALWARYTVVRYTFGAIYTLYAIYFAGEMQL